MAQHTVTRIYNAGVKTFTDQEQPSYGAALPAIDETIAPSASNFQITFSRHVPLERRQRTALFCRSFRRQCDDHLRDQHARRSAQHPRPL
jgi:hypothetical protein